MMSVARRTTTSFAQYTGLNNSCSIKTPSGSPSFGQSNASVTTTTSHSFSSYNSASERIAGAAATNFRFRIGLRNCAVTLSAGIYRILRVTEINILSNCNLLAIGWAFVSAVDECVVVAFSRVRPRVITELLGVVVGARLGCADRWGQPC